LSPVSTPPSLHDALPISTAGRAPPVHEGKHGDCQHHHHHRGKRDEGGNSHLPQEPIADLTAAQHSHTNRHSSKGDHSDLARPPSDRKSTRLNSSHLGISY